MCKKGKLSLWLAVFSSISAVKSERLWLQPFQVFSSLSGLWNLAFFCQGIKAEPHFKCSIIPAGINEEAKKIQKACLQI